MFCWPAAGQWDTYHCIAAIAGQDDDINGGSVVGNTDSSILGFILTDKMETGRVLIYISYRYLWRIYCQEVKISEWASVEVGAGKPNISRWNTLSTNNGEIWDKNKAKSVLIYGQSIKLRSVPFFLDHCKDLRRSKATHSVYVKGLTPQACWTYYS